MLETGVPNLEHLLGGGVPAFSLNIIAGQPGTGKTILAHQIAFHNTRISPEAKVLILTTLSEPVIKMIRYMQHFSFFDEAFFGDRIQHLDIGQIIRDEKLAEVAKHVEHHIFEHNPDMVIIDSFKAISDLSPSDGDFRRFCYELSISLAAARCTSFLVGEYDKPEIAAGAEFAVADGILYLEIDQAHGETLRRIWVRKMRGCAADLAPTPFFISTDGIRVMGPRIFSTREKVPADQRGGIIPTGITGLDQLLQGGMLPGRGVILSGVSGTGKTTLGLQFMVMGALSGKRGMIFSFEESTGSLHRLASGFGWDLAALERDGLLKIAYTPQNAIRTEEHMDWMLGEVLAFKPDRLLVDSFSVFLYKVKDESLQREKTFQIASVVRETGTQALLISDIPAADPHRLSRFGVEETVLDGTIVLCSEMIGQKRRRFLEVFKMRGVDNIPGRHRMDITSRGILVYYCQPPTGPRRIEPPAITFEPIQHLVRGKLRYGSSWLIRGTPGVGKSTLAFQFAVQALQRKEAVLFVAIDSPVVEVIKSMENLNFLPEPYLESGKLVILDAFKASGGDLDLADPESLLFTLAGKLEKMTGPTVLLLDSLSPVSMGYKNEDFVSLVYRKNRLLGRENLAVLDIILSGSMEESHQYSLMNAYDIVIDLFTPDWGEMKFAGQSGYRALKMTKVRGARVDGRPYPYIISTNDGLVVQKDYYLD